MTYSRTKVALIIALATITLSGRVSSGQSTVTDCLKIPACDDQYYQAAQISKAGAHEEALAKFQILYRQHPDPVILYAIAIQLHRLGRHAEAITMYQRYLASGHAKDPVKIAQVHEHISEANQELTATESRRGSVQVADGNLRAMSTLVTTQANSAVPTAKPIYKQWWLWTIVGVTVAGVVVGASLGAYALPPNYPDAVALRPLP